MTEKIVTANRLADGLVVYMNGAGWSERIEQARIAQGDAEAARLLAEAERPGQALEVVGPYLIAVGRDDDVPRPVSHREVIRARGPSVRPDLGKQADLA
jgi:hypothetical protein